MWHNGIELHARCCLESPKENGCLEEPGIQRTVILKSTLRKQDWKVRIEFEWLKIGQNGGLREHGNEYLDRTKSGEFLT